MKTTTLKEELDRHNAMLFRDLWRTTLEHYLNSGADVDRASRKANEAVDRYLERFEK